MDKGYIVWSKYQFSVPGTYMCKFHISHAVIPTMENNNAYHLH